jgi:uncharacterized protein YdhG (YjbR/CyaY superfamily)
MNSANFMQIWQNDSCLKDPVMRDGRQNRTEGISRAEDVDAYLAKVPEPARTTLEKLRETIRAVVPSGTTEGLSYGIPALHYKGALVAYAAFMNHCSFFPMQASLIDEMEEELKGYRTSKGTLQFPLDKPLPASLVKKIVKKRIAENERKMPSAGRK